MSRCTKAETSLDPDEFFWVDITVSAVLVTTMIGIYLMVMVRVKNGICSRVYGICSLKYKARRFV